MNSTSYDSNNNHEQSIINLVKTPSLTDLLQQDHEDLLKQSFSIAYYHPNIDREKAEQLLKQQYITSKCDGLFLIRDCSASSYDFSLSLMHNNKCYHYKIQLIYDIYFSIDCGPQIAGIENLIHYYQQHADGLVCNLANVFIPCQPPPITLRLMAITNTLHRACQENNVNIVKKILSAKYYIYRPDVNAKDSQGSTALHQASYFGYDDIVGLLIKAGSHILAHDANGATALHRAAAGNRPSTLLVLINEGLANYEERNYNNFWTPLHEAAYYNSAACVRILLDYGSSLRPRTNDGKTPLQLAEETKSDESILILRQYKTPPAKSCRFDWLHDQSNLDRLSARQLIESMPNGPIDGMFIVRRSATHVDNYVLTLFYNNEFFNFEIICLNETTFYIDDGPYFDSLEHLIDHHCRMPDGLPTILICSVNILSEVVPSRIQQFSHLRMTSQTADIPTFFKYNLTPSDTVDETKHLTDIQPTSSLLSSSMHAPKILSSLNSSMTSLNSSISSRSRASSLQETPLSNSSSNLSLTSPSSLSKQTNSLIFNESSSKNNTTFVDRRNIVGGKLRPFTPDFNNEIKQNQSNIIPTMKTNLNKNYKVHLISPDQIKQIAKLGEGEFGEVYKGYYQENSITTPVAIKVLKDYSYAAKQDFLREAEHMSKLNHHSICKLYGIVDSDGTDMMMIIELLLFGSMYDYLMKYKLRVSEYRLKLWASQIADGMAYIESKGLVHRDLAARNILLESANHVKISDFGLSRCVDSDIYVQKSDSKIPVKWYSPEAISLGKFSSKSDVWSFGITLWEMFSYAAVPYGDMSGSDVYYSLKQGNRLEKPLHCPPYIYQIMRKCWEWDEKERPTFFQLVQLLKNEFDLSPVNPTVRRPTLLDDSTDEKKTQEYRMAINKHDSNNATKF